MTENIDYEKLRLDVLKKLSDERDLPTNGNKKELIDNLLLFDKDKYMWETTYEKDGNGYIVGIDLKNSSHLIQMGNLILKNEGRCLNKYYNSRVYYWSTQKLL